MKKIFVVAAIITSSQLIAQDTTALEQVTLTANKYSTKTTETGKVVVLISRQDIEKAGSRDLSQVIAEMGGVFINGYTNNQGKEKNIYLRGARVDHTLITIDGVPVYDASGIGSNFDIRNFPIDNIERIEILKGSQSTLYGSDAIAGVINIITRKGGTKPTVSGAIHYGSFNSKRANLNLAGKSGVIDYNVGLNHYSTDGFSEARRPEGATETFDRDGFNQNNIQAGLGIQAHRNVRFQPFIRFSRINSDLDQDAFTDEKDYTSTAKNLQAGIGNFFTLGKTNLNLIYQYQHTNRTYLDDSTSVGGFYIYNDNTYIAKEHFAEAVAIIPFGKVKLTAGADFRASNTDYDALQKNIFSPSLDPSSYSGDSVKQNQQSIYAALHVQANKLSLEAGGRFNQHSEYGSNFAFNLNPSLRLNQQVKIFSNLSTGYRVPSLYQLFSVYGNKALQPETSLNLEGGIQLLSADEKSSIRATYFRRDVKDAIAFFFDPVSFQSRYINQDEQKDRGFELDGRMAIGNKLELKAFYSYVDGNISTKVNGKDTSYFNLLRRPKSLLNILAGYKLSDKIYFNTQVNAVGKSRDIYFDPNTWEAVDIRLKSYILLNFYAEFGFSEKLKVFADLRNITDATYSDVYGYNTAGFNVYGGLRFRL